jgi:hypothetical protein
MNSWGPRLRFLGGTRTGRQKKCQCERCLVRIAPRLKLFIGLRHCRSPRSVRGSGKRFVPGAVDQKSLKLDLTSLDEVTRWSLSKGRPEHIGRSAPVMHQRIGTETRTRLVFSSVGRSGIRGTIPRTARVALGGQAYHVLNRSTGRTPWPVQHPNAKLSASRFPSLRTQNRPRPGFLTRS